MEESLKIELKKRQRYYYWKEHTSNWQDKHYYKGKKEVCLELLEHYDDGAEYHQTEADRLEKEFGHLPQCPRCNNFAEMIDLSEEEKKPEPLFDCNECGGTNEDENKSRGIPSYDHCEAHEPIQFEGENPKDLDAFEDIAWKCQCGYTNLHYDMVCVECATLKPDEDIEERKCWICNNIFKPDDITSANGGGSYHSYHDDEEVTKTIPKTWSYHYHQRKKEQHGEVQIVDKEQSSSDRLRTNSSNASPPHLEEALEEMLEDEPYLMMANTTYFLVHEGACIYLKPCPKPDIEKHTSIKLVTNELVTKYRQDEYSLGAEHGKKKALRGMDKDAEKEKENMHKCPKCSTYNFYYDPAIKWRRCLLRTCRHEEVLNPQPDPDCPKCRGNGVYQFAGGTDPPMQEMCDKCLPKLEKGQDAQIIPQVKIAEGTIHKKTWPKYFQMILDGKKGFDLRLHDFDVNPTDIIIFEEWDPKINNYTGRTTMKRIDFILFTKELDYWTKEEIDHHGYVVMQLVNVTTEEALEEGAIIKAEIGEYL